MRTQTLLRGREEGKVSEGCAEGVGGLQPDCPASPCSSPMSFALKTYMTHMGICLREPRPASVVEKSQEKDKWLPFFPKTKKVGGEAGKGGALRSSPNPP